MSDFLRVVETLGGQLIEQLEWTGPLVTEAVLAAAATVPYNEDVHAYLEQVTPVIRVAFETAMQPTLVAALANLAAQQARYASLLAQNGRATREFEAFRRLKTSKTIQ